MAGSIQLANRNFNRFQALEKEVKSLYAEVSIGASGAPTLESGLGIASISRTSQGNYDVVLQDTYNRLMHFSVMQLEAGTQGLHYVINAEAVATSSSKTISFHTVDAAASSPDPSNGSKLFIRIDLKNSSV